MQLNQKKILEVINDKNLVRFTAVDLADIIGYPTDVTVGEFRVCPNMTKLLLKLCKQGILYQWITGNGPCPFTRHINPTATYTVNYVKRDSDFAKLLENHPNRFFAENGYRIR